MNIDNLTIKEAREIANLFSNVEKAQETLNEGFCVVVLDNGFILVGELVISGDWAVVKKAKGLRSWSSGKGLEWHIENGKENCVIDGKGTDRRFHVSKLQNWGQTDETKW